MRNIKYLKLLLRKKANYMVRIIAILTILFITVPSFTQDIDYKGLPEWTKHTQGTTEYYLYTPGNIKPGQKVPIALFMHCLLYTSRCV